MVKKNNLNKCLNKNLEKYLIKDLINIVKSYVCICGKNCTKQCYHCEDYMCEYNSLFEICKKCYKYFHMQKKCMNEINAINIKKLYKCEFCNFYTNLHVKCNKCDKKFCNNCGTEYKLSCTPIYTISYYMCKNHAYSN